MYSWQSVCWSWILPLLPSFTFSTCSSWLWMASDCGCCKLILCAHTRSTWCWCRRALGLPPSRASQLWRPHCSLPELPLQMWSPQSLQSERRRRSKVNLWFTTRTRSQWRLHIFWLGFYPIPSIFTVLLDSIGWHRNVCHPSAVAGHQHLHPASVDHGHIRNTVCYHLRVHDAGHET